MKSNFEILEKNQQSLFYELQIKNILTGEYVNILPNLGARLNSAWLKADDKLIPVIKELKNDQLKSNDEMFNNAKLFPFANRIRKGRYSFNDKVFELPVNYVEEENSCHGFLYNSTFEIISKNIFNDYAEIIFGFTPKIKYEGYPFCFDMKITHKLNTSGEIETTTELFNSSQTEILFSDGWHPYYSLDETADNYSVTFNAKEKLELDDHNIPNGKVIHINGSTHHNISLKNKKLDDLFRFSGSNKANIIKIVPVNSDHIIKIWHESGQNKYNYLVLYIPPDRKSIAVEPMTSSIDAFNNKEGIIILKPGESWSASMGFSLYKK